VDPGQQGGHVTVPHSGDLVAFVAGRICFQIQAPWNCNSGCQKSASKGGYYVGLTDDMHARLEQHNKGSVPHSSKLRPWRIKTAVTFTDRTSAAKFEKYLKSDSGRAFAQRHF
jgi:putative endonuclease